MTVIEKTQSAFDVMKAEFGYTNKMATPKITKVVVSVGTGNLMKKDRTKNDFVADRLGKITGQKPAIRQAKKSIASFKIRQGDQIGVMVTLRGKLMYNFLEKKTFVELMSK